MHALIKSEAYYLMSDPIIRRWENRATLKRCADNLRTRLQCTGRAYTNIFTIAMRDNSAIVKTCGKVYEVRKGFIYGNLENILQLEHDGIQLQKFLLKGVIV